MNPAPEPAVTLVPFDPANFPAEEGARIGALFEAMADPTLAAFNYTDAPVAVSLAEALWAARVHGGRNLWEAIELGICPVSGAWGEGTVYQPPAGMYELWRQAVDLVYPLIGVDSASFEDDYDRYYCMRVRPDTEAWWDRDAAQVAEVLARAVAVAREGATEKKGE